MQRKQKRKIRQLYIKVLLLLIIVLIAILTIRGVMARYESSASSSADVYLAYYIFKEESISQTLKLQSILPRQAPYTYTFLVANHENNERTQTALEYTIELETTTNLPLEFSVHEQGETQELITATSTSQDSDGTYFRHINIQGGEFGFRTDQEVTYVLEVTFPSRWNSSQYEGIIEYLQLTIDSKQKINV